MFWPHTEKQVIATAPSGVIYWLSLTLAPCNFQKGERERKRGLRGKITHGVMKLLAFLMYQSPRATDCAHGRQSMQGWNKKTHVGFHFSGVILAYFFIMLAVVCFCKEKQRSVALYVFVSWVKDLTLGSMFAKMAKLVSQ